MYPASNVFAKHILYRRRGKLGGGGAPRRALANAGAAIVKWRDAASQLNRKSPKPDSLGQWRQRVPRSLHEKLKITAGWYW